MSPMFKNLRTIGTVSVLFSQLFIVAPAFAQQVYQDDRGQTYYDFICHEHNSKGECTNYSFITPRSRTRGYYDDNAYPTTRYTSDRYRQLSLDRGIDDSTYYNRNSYNNSRYNYNNYNNRNYLSQPYDYYTSSYDNTRYYRPTSYYYDNRYHDPYSSYDEAYYRNWYDTRYGRDCNTCRCDRNNDDNCDK